MVVELRRVPQPRVHSMKFPVLTSCLAALAALAAPGLANSCGVYPTPQLVKLEDKTVRPTRVSVELRGPDSRGGIWDKLPTTARGGYGINVEADGTVNVYANDDDGVFYAKQTVSQLLRGVEGANGAQRDPFPGKGVQEVAQLGELPVGSIVDWPDVPFRGVIEGFYGIPWSFEARKSQFEFYGRNKMNFYLYAPKDDPLHHGQGCYEAYPPEKAEELRQLVEVARANHVHFVWAIHPSNTVNWNVNDGRDQMDALIRKLESMYELGVRDFGVSVDDSFGEISRAERQVQLCNYIVENFIRKHPDVNQSLVMCPTGYTRQWARPQDLETLGRDLAEGTAMFWTGNGVVCDITLEGQQWLRECHKRPAFIWWNWPCNDFKPSRLSMGRTYGLAQEPQMRTMLSGFAANPMERAEASKVGLFGVADYAWNICAFKSDEAWKTGIARLYPGCADAMQVFCNHNADLLPNCHNWPKEESQEVRPVINRFRQCLSQGEPDTEACAAMRAEFQRVAEAGETLQAAPDAAGLAKDIGPWLRRFTMTGQAGVKLVDALTSDESDTEGRIEAFLQAGGMVDAMGGISREAWQNNQVVRVQDVQVGSRAVTPALMSVYRHLNARLYAKMSGCNINTLVPAFSSSCPDIADAGNVQDEDPGTYWTSTEQQQSGDWICLDMGVPVAIRTVTLAMGSENSRLEVAAEGQFETSLDGKTWQPLGDIQNRPAINLDLRRTPVTARMLRYRIIRPNPRRLTVAEFAINRPLPVNIRQTLQDMPGIAAYNENSSVGLARQLEVVKAVPGSYLEMSFPSPIICTGVNINLDNSGIGKWSRVDLVLGDGTTVTPQLHQRGKDFFLPSEKVPQQGIAAVRLTNISENTEEIKINTFQLTFPTIDDDVMVESMRDRDFATAYNCGRKALNISMDVPEGRTELLVVGNAECTVDNKPCAERNGRLQLFKLKPGAAKVRIRAPQKDDTGINEIIFR